MPMGFITELRSHLTGLAGSLRSRRAYGDQLKAEVGVDIVDDLAVAQAKVGAVAHRAETNDREAARLLDAAQAPDSDGGRAITPREAAPIQRLILRSAEADHDITESLA